MVENIAVFGLVSTHDPVKGLQQCLIRESSRVDFGQACCSLFDGLVFLAPV
jgi:hypothetical protein